MKLDSELNGHSIIHNLLLFKEGQLEKILGLHQR